MSITCAGNTVLATPSIAARGSTVGVWVYWDGTDSRIPLSQHFGAGSRIQLYIDGGILSCSLGFSSAYLGKLVANQWYYLGWVCQSDGTLAPFIGSRRFGSKYRLWISDTTFSVTASSGAVAIGGLDPDVIGFGITLGIYGNLSRCTVWDSARTAAQLEAAMNVAGGVPSAAWAHYELAAHTTANNDTSGNGRTATPFGGTSTPTTGANVVDPPDPNDAALIISCCGNSLTQGDPYGGDPYPGALATLRPGDDVTNWGIAGYNVAECRGYAYEHVLPTFDPTVGNVALFFEYSNDSGDSFDAAQQIARETDFVAFMQARGFYVILTTPFPFVTGNETIRATLSAAILAGDLGSDWEVDAGYDAGWQNPADTSDYTDGVHGTTATYAGIAAYFDDGIDDWLASLDGAPGLAPMLADDGPARPAPAPSRVSRADAWHLSALSAAAPSRLDWMNPGARRSRVEPAKPRLLAAGDLGTRMAPLLPFAAISDVPPRPREVRTARPLPTPWALAAAIPLAATLNLAPGVARASPAPTQRAQTTQAVGQALAFPSIPNEPPRVSGQRPNSAQPEQTWEITPLAFPAIPNYPPARGTPTITRQPAPPDWILAPLAFPSIQNDPPARGNAPLTLRPAAAQWDLAPLAFPAIQNYPPVRGEEQRISRSPTIQPIGAVALAAASSYVPDASGRAGRIDAGRQPLNQAWSLSPFVPPALGAFFGFAAPPQRAQADPRELPQSQANDGLWGPLVPFPSPTFVPDASATRVAPLPVPQRPRSAEPVGDQLAFASVGFFDLTPRPPPRAGRGRAVWQTEPLSALAPALSTWVPDSVTPVGRPDLPRLAARVQAAELPSLLVLSLSTGWLALPVVRARPAIGVAPMLAGVELLPPTVPPAISGITFDLAPMPVRSRDEASRHWRWDDPPQWLSVAVVPTGPIYGVFSDDEEDLTPWGKFIPEEP